MSHETRLHPRSLRGIAGSTLRWFTAFDPFGPYASVVGRR